MKIKAFITYLSAIFFVTSLGSVFAQNSADIWLKLSIPQSGVYKLTGKEIAATGIKLNNLNAEKIEFYSSDGRVLSQFNGSTIPKGLTSIPTKYSGETKLDRKSTFYFYATGSNDGEALHPYDKYNYVFVKINGNQRTRISKIDSKIGSADKETLKSTLVKEKRELERYNLVKGGRQWYGDFINSVYYQNLSLNNLLLDQEIVFKYSLLSTASSVIDFLTFEKDQIIDQISLPKSIHNSSDPFARYNRIGNIVDGKVTFKTNSEDIKLRFEVPNPLKSSDGAYLDYYELAYQKLNGFYKNQHIGYLSKKKNETVSLQLEGKNGNIWIIDSFSEPKELDLSNPSFTTSKDSLSLVFWNNESALNVSKISAINIADTPLDFTPELLIISPKSYFKAAEKLAQHRRTVDNLDAVVVDQEEIYNNYSGGKTDPSAIRNYVRELWQRNPEKLKYLLLFADADYDFKNNQDLDFVDIKNYIPAYQSRESLEPIYSFSSDDYFGFLQEGIGFWPEGSSTNNSWRSTTDKTHLLDIAVGRLPVKSLLEAYDVVNKIISYETEKENLGTWRNKVTFVADDGDFNIHLRDAERFSSQLKDSEGVYEINKLYLDAYEQVNSANGIKSPTAEAALEKTINDGSFIINYNGHGSENGWTDEKLLTLDQIFRWKNKTKQPIFFTATCEYGRYDNPLKVSGAELSLLNKNSGAIALLTTTRPVFSSTNFSINQAFYAELEKKSFERLGDLFRVTKNNSIQGELNRNFTLLGDPSLKLMIPDQKIEITSINDQSTDFKLISGEKVKIKGRISGENTNGIIRASFFDSPTTFKTLGESSNSTPVVSFVHKLFEGETNVVNGLFEFEFIVPLISETRVEAGKATFYAVNADSTKDYNGVLNSYQLIKNVNAEFLDKTPPKVSLKNGSTSQLLVETFDESGINVNQNLSNGLISLLIDDSLKFILNDYYAAYDGFQNGRIDFKLPILGKGQHSLQLILADVYNNITTETFLLLVEEKKNDISSMVSFPNPTEDIVNIVFEHSQEGEDLEFKLNIFDLQGQLLASDTRQCYICESKVELGMNLETSLLLNGTYFYQVISTNLKSGAFTREGGKIIFWK